MKCESNIVVIGGGIAGLFIAFRAAIAGYTVTILEGRSHLGGVASLRNEAWLHSGSFLAASISQPSIALEVARGLKDGFAEFWMLCPNAISSMSTLALVPASRLSETLDRWAQADVRHRRVYEAGSFRIPDGYIALEVPDRAINTRIVMSRLYRLLKRLGVRILTDVQPLGFQRNQLIVTHRKERLHFLAQQFVHTTGARIAETIALAGGNLAVRFWKSHLIDIIAPPIAFNLFTLGRRELNVFNHGRYAICGLSEEQTPIDSLDCEPNPEVGQEFRDSLDRLFGSSLDYSTFNLRSCVKVDLARDAGFDPCVDERSGLAYCRPQLGHVCSTKQSRITGMRSQER